MEYLFLAISIVGIVFGADWLVGGAVSIAKRLKVSDFVIGAAIVGVGTSMPELVVSFIGAVGGNSDVAIGNVIGSNIFNVFGILGLTAIFFPIAVAKSNMKFEIPVCIAVSVMFLLCAFNFFTIGTSEISWIDGIILLLFFAVFMYYSFYRDRKESKLAASSASTSVPEENGKVSPLWLSIVMLVGGLGLLITSCDFFVDNAIIVAKSLGLSDAVIAITLIACGTSLPELAASVAAALKKNTQMALGNIVGSNIFNITLILGLSSQVTTLTTKDIVLADYLVMIAASILPIILGYKGKIGRPAGVFLFAVFIAYNIYLIA